jgi:hypothetical protein
MPPEHYEQQNAAPGVMPKQEEKAPQPTSAEITKVIEEDLNIAVQAGIEAAEIASADPNFPEETKEKIGTATVLLAEALEETQAPAIPTDKGPGMGPAR